jgi:16S rRNA (uracil1498-N3)-methyltransferase
VNPRFFVAVPLSAGATVSLPAAVAHHATRVLRLAAGDAVTLFDGNGGEYEGAIARADRDRVDVAIAGFVDVEREAPRPVTLAQAIIATDPMDWAIRKAVELGAARIVPLVAARSNVARAGERLDKRLAHWRQIAVAACEQCGRNRVPAIDAPIPFADWLERDDPGCRAMLAPRASRSLANLARESSVDAVIVGPEGGFDAGELALADRCGVARVHLGPRTLRAETAAAAALATIAAIGGDAA